MDNDERQRNHGQSIGATLGTLARQIAQRGLLRASSPILVCAVSLFCLDLVFLVIHCLSVFLSEGLIGSGNADSLQYWRVDQDKSFPEFYEYLKTATIGILALICARFRGFRVYGPVVITALVLLLDNSFQMHERSKSIIIPAFGLGKGPAELAYIITVGLILLIALLYGFVKAGRDDRVVLSLFIALFVTLGFFGGGVDLLHTEIGWRSRKFDLVLAFVEDGGELITLSAACALLAAAAAGRAYEHRGK